MDHASEALRREFDRLEGKLERRLERMEVHLLEPADGERFAGALARQTRSDLDRLKKLLPGRSIEALSTPRDNNKYLLVTLEI